MGNSTRGFLGIVVFTAVSLLSACAPYPHYEYYAPATVGRITQDGQPVVGARVAVSGHFVSTVAEARTDSSGYFELPPIREFDWTVTLFGDRLYTYQLTISAGGKDYLGYLRSGIGNPTETDSLQCDLDKPVPIYRTTGYCSSVENLSH